MDIQSHLSPLQDGITDLLSAGVNTIREADLEYSDNDFSPMPENALLSGWVMISVWIDPEDGEHLYHRLRSKGRAVHERIGLARMAVEWDG